LFEEQHRRANSCAPSQSTRRGQFLISARQNTR
jgi:hypothetical protein